MSVTKRVLRTLLTKKQKGEPADPARLSCLTCGAVIHPDLAQIHIDWHNQLWNQLHAAAAGMSLTQSMN